MLDWFNILLIGVIILVAGFIGFSILRTMGTIKKSGLSDSERHELAARLRQRDVLCPRCGRQSSALLHTEIKYKCDSCNHVFEGPRHLA